MLAGYSYDEIRFYLAIIVLIYCTYRFIEAFSIEHTLLNIYYDFLRYSRFEFIEKEESFLKNNIIFFFAPYYYNNLRDPYSVYKKLNNISKRMYRHKIYLFGSMFLLYDQSYWLIVWWLLLSILKFFSNFKVFFLNGLDEMEAYKICVIRAGYKPDFKAITAFKNFNDMVQPKLYKTVPSIVATKK